MFLRHIRPRSVEWYDAITEEVERGMSGLSPEEKVKLRAMQDADHAILGSIHAEPIRRGLRAASIFERR
jgi:hypothetical protein